MPEPDASPGPVTGASVLRALARHVTGSAVAGLNGAFVNPDPVYPQSAGFGLDPAGNVVSVYSSGAIGRLVPDNVVGLARYPRDHPVPAAA